MKINLAFFVASILLASPSSQEERRPKTRTEGEVVQERKESSYNSRAALYQTVKTAQSFADLAKKLKLNQSSFPSHKKTVKMAASSGSQVVDTRPHKIHCQTKNQCVDIAQPRDGSGLHWPFCAIVPQCSGCCGLMSTLMTCQPTIKTNHSVEVMYIPYTLSSSNGGSSSNMPRMVSETVEVHEQCNCNCRKTPSSCSTRQTFSWDYCECLCKQSSRKICRSPFKWDESICGCRCARPKRRCDSSNKIWDATACDCICKAGVKCSPNYVFNQKTCVCERNLVHVFNLFKSNNQG